MKKLAILVAALPRTAHPASRAIGDGRLVRSALAARRGARAALASAEGRY